MTALKLDGGATLLGRGALRAASAAADAAAAAFSASFFAALKAALRFVLGAMLGADPATLLGRGLSFGATGAAVVFLSLEVVDGLGRAAELLGRGAIDGLGAGFEAAGLETAAFFLSADAPAGTTDARRPTAYREGAAPTDEVLCAGLGGLREVVEVARESVGVFTR